MSLAPLFPYTTLFRSGWPHLHPEHAHAVLDPPPPETPRSPQRHPDPRHNPPTPWAHHAHGNGGRDEKHRAEQHTRRGSADQRNRSEHRERLTRPGQSTEAEQSTRPGRPTGVERSTRAEIGRASCREIEKRGE